MKIINKETPCEICGMGVVVGKMAQVPEGYVCEECVYKMANSDLVEIDASQQAVEGGQAKNCDCKDGPYPGSIEYCVACGRDLYPPAT